MCSTARNSDLLGFNFTSTKTQYLAKLLSSPLSPTYSKQLLTVAVWRNSSGFLPNSNSSPHWVELILFFWCGRLQNNGSEIFGLSVLFQLPTLVPAVQHLSIISDTNCSTRSPASKYYFRSVVSVDCSGHCLQPVVYCTRVTRLLSLP